MVSKTRVMNNYSMSVCWIRDGKIAKEARSAELAITSLVSDKREWNKCVIKFSLNSERLDTCNQFPAWQHLTQFS